GAARSAGCHRSTQTRSTTYHRAPTLPGPHLRGAGRCVGLSGRYGDESPLSCAQSAPTTPRSHPELRRPWSGGLKMNREDYEILLMKAVDGVATPDDMTQLERWWAEHPGDRAEFDDFVGVKATTDLL